VYAIHHTTLAVAISCNGQHYIVNRLYSSVHYLASSLVLASLIGLLSWLLPARTSRSLSPMSPARGALVVLPRPVFVFDIPVYIKKNTEFVAIVSSVRFTQE